MWHYTAIHTGSNVRGCVCACVCACVRVCVCVCVWERERERERQEADVNTLSKCADVNTLSECADVNTFTDQGKWVYSKANKFYVYLSFLWIRMWLTFSNTVFYKKSKREKKQTSSDQHVFNASFKVLQRVKSGHTYEAIRGCMYEQWISHLIAFIFQPGLKWKKWHVWSAFRTVLLA